MGMKRFSAPPVLYPLSNNPSSSTTTPTPSSRDSPFPQPSSSSSCSVSSTAASTPSGSGHQHHQHQQHPHHPNNHHPHHHHHHHHDSVSKRVKTEQTFESLFDTETHSDVTIRLNGDDHVFHAHRMILAMKSEVFSAMLSKMADREEEVVGVMQFKGEGRPGVPVLRVEEDAECSEVFSRFLYFLYSGAVWLHHDYVLPLFRLAHKYGVKALKTHCQNYILQVLAKSCGTQSSSSSNQNHNHNHNVNNNNNNNNTSNNPHNHSPAHAVLSSPNGNSPPYSGSGFSLNTVCGIYEDEAYEGDIRLTAYRLLCCQFRQLVTSQRWLRCQVGTVCALIGSDACNVEENLILVSATDYMKRNNLSDKRQIQEILSLIRYPRLHRRVLYHLHKNASFRNFPHIQQLMLNAVKFHSFKDLPEAKDDFAGPQFRPRMASSGSSPVRRASTHVSGLTEVDEEYPSADRTMFEDAAFSLDSPMPVTLTRSRQSQV